MADSPQSQAVSHQVPVLASEPSVLSLAALRRRLSLLQKLVPIGLLLLVIVYEIGPARWIHDRLGDTYHFVAEILVYGTVGPALAYMLLDFLGRWLEERETSELQAKVLAQAREHARISHQLSDEAVQALFAASMLLTSFKSSLSELPPEVAPQLREAEQGLHQAIQQLRAHLLNDPSPKG